ncbi:MAG: MerR family transcriptional regulator [Desulfuromonadaceae bacterium]|nr:MerR family transcriptional regulator [Desulfuromonadaceae bacterium]
MSNDLFSISDIERESGIRCDTLRVWERRYGFPTPSRNERGERVYPREQLLRLRLIKQLQDRGMQPGKLVSLEYQQLQRLTSRPDNSALASADVEMLLDMLSSGLGYGLSNKLEALLSLYGLRIFLADVVAPMNHAVGKAWFEGKIGILDEHLYAETIRNVLTVALGGLPQGVKNPRVLLTTLPGEQHGIGLLMVACMLRLEGAGVVMAGVQTPLEEIVRGAIECGSGIVGISCSEYMGRRTIASQLVKLRALLPEDVALWAGGSGVRTLAFLKDNVRLFNDLDQIQPAVQAARNVN